VPGEDLDQLETLFHALRDLPEPERAAAAARLAGAEAASRALALVAAYERSRERARQSARSPGPLRFGPYREVRLIGRGGMGAVYLAERVDGQFEQQVAVKVVAAGSLAQPFRERFLAERQILAGLQHPNITRLLDGGVTEDGTPYLAMEYVAGQPIDQYCDERRLPLADRIRLVLGVCGAVEHAHRHLVVHRDLKPSNILVTPEGEPKLLDFGTARILSEADGGQSTVPLLTPRYASPEQLRGAAVSVATDVYSLGVVLYELLTGRWPFGADPTMEAALAPATREAPPAPPHSVVTAAAAEKRSSPLGALVRSLAGDLGSILGKCLENEPARRYLSVRELAEDLEAYLAGRPVKARAATVLYQARKFLRRHWLGVAATTAAAAALVVLATVAILQARRARTEAERAREFAAYSRSILLSGTPYSGLNSLAARSESATVREAVAQAGAALDAQPPADPLVEADLRIWLSGALFLTFDAVGAAREIAKVRPEMVRRLTPEQQFTYFAQRCLLAPAGPDPAPGLELCRQPLAIAERHPETDFMNRSVGHTVLARFHADRTADLATAERHARIGTELGRARWGEGAWRYSNAQVLLGAALQRQGRFAEARDVLLPLAAAQEKASPEPFELAETRWILRYCYQGLEDLPHALELSTKNLAAARRRLGEERALCTDFLSSYLVDMADAGRAREVLALARHANRSCAGRGGAGNQDQFLGMVLTRAGFAAEGEPYLRRAVAQYRTYAKLGQGHLAWALREWARALIAVGRPAAAIPLLRESEEDFRLRYGPGKLGERRARELRERAEALAARRQ
jgi:hypothetical protein